MWLLKFWVCPNPVKLISHRWNSDFATNEHTLELKHKMLYSHTSNWINSNRIVARSIGVPTRHRRRILSNTGGNYDRFTKNRRNDTPKARINFRVWSISQGLRVRYPIFNGIVARSIGVPTRHRRPILTNHGGSYDRFSKNRQNDTPKTRINFRVWSISQGLTVRYSIFLNRIVARSIGIPTRHSRPILSNTNGSYGRFSVKERIFSPQNTVFGL